jgi:hypothetical protein
MEEGAEVEEGETQLWPLYFTKRSMLCSTTKVPVIITPTTTTGSTLCSTTKVSVIITQATIKCTSNITITSQSLATGSSDFDN